MGGLDTPTTSWERMTGCRNVPDAMRGGKDVPKKGRLLFRRVLDDICKTVAEMLDLVRDGADLGALDACPVAVKISGVRRKEHSRARVYSVVFLFKHLPATVVLR